jgi:hypothetical protein
MSDLVITSSGGDLQLGAVTFTATGAVVNGDLAYEDWARAAAGRITEA